ncbi:MAG TPA: phosphatase PAP2 family protein, partial [Dehalococcoidia bacterium]|nr:phosphatase PAP2 family protein [Dehalococcoidia bacterium]
VHWYDWLTALLYLLHFVVPLAVAYLFWHWRRPLFQRFVRSYVLLIYAGFTTYLVYPMAPPWYASNLGRIPEVHKVLDAVQWQGMGDPVTLLSRFFQTDPIAAMPSMHAAFPVLVWLVLWRVWPRWGWIAVVYPLAMSFAVIYAGEHYLVDVLAGWLYAGAAFGLTWRSYGSARRARRPRRAAAQAAVVVPLPRARPANGGPQPAYVTVEPDAHRPVTRPPSRVRQ